MGKCTMWGETPGRDVSLGALCYHGTDVLRGPLPLLLPQLCLGSVDRFLKSLLGLCCPTPVWLEAVSFHSLFPSTHSHRWSVLGSSPSLYKTSSGYLPSWCFPLHECCSSRPLG